MVGLGPGGTKRCRLSLLTNIALVLVIRVQMRGGGGGGVAGSRDSSQPCVHHVTWSPNKLWRSTSIINLCLGPSGCGKTSLLQSLVGKLRIDSGSILVFGFRPGSR